MGKSGKRRRRWPIPSDWNENDNGDECAVVVFCIPNSRQWRSVATTMVDDLAWGWNWDERTGRVKDAQSVGRDIFGSMCIVNCDVFERLIGTNEKLVAALTGQKITLEEDGIPVEYDYETNGIRPTLQQLLKTDYQLYPNLTITEAVIKGLIGRQAPDVGDLIPWDGEGLADIQDERLAELSGRFRQSDSSITDPLGEKNITETLETLLRMDKATDLEGFTPNIATMLSVGDSPYLTGIKSMIRNLVSKFNLPESVASFLDDRLDNQEYMSIADIMLLILQALQALDDLDLQSIVEINNQMGCGCGGDCDCDNAETETITADGDDEVVVDV